MHIIVWTILICVLTANNQLNASSAPLIMSSNRAGQVLFTRNTDTNDLLGEASGVDMPKQRFYKYDVIINRAANYYQIDPLFIKAILLAESGLNANAVSKANARGIAQFMRGTANEIGIDNRYDPVTSIWGCAALLRRHCDRFNGNMILMTAAYNAGPEAIRRARGCVPHIRETKDYVSRVLWMWERMHSYH